MNKYLFIFPTRGRPWAALEAIASIKLKASRPERVDILLCQDNDDESRFSLKADGVSMLFAQRMRFVAWMNHALATVVKSEYSHIQWGSDDVRFLTQGWDDVVQKHHNLVVYGEDGIQNEKKPTHPFIRSSLIDALVRGTGHFLAPELVHQFSDPYIGEIAQALGSLQYDPALKVEHLHYSVKKAVRDQNYADSEKCFWSDKKTWETIVKPRIPEIADKLPSLL